MQEKCINPENKNIFIKSWLDENNIYVDKLPDETRDNTTPEYWKVIKNGIDVYIIDQINSPTIMVHIGSLTDYDQTSQEIEILVDKQYTKQDISELSTNIEKIGAKIDGIWVPKFNRFFFSHNKDLNTDTDAFIFIIPKVMPKEFIKNNQIGYYKYIYYIMHDDVNIEAPKEINTVEIDSYDSATCKKLGDLILKNDKLFSDNELIKFFDDGIFDYSKSLFHLVMKNRQDRHSFYIW